MNKTEFVTALAEKVSLSKKEAKDVLDAALDIIATSMKKGEEVRLLGFGTFSVTKRAARTAVNPQKKGEKIQIPARKVVKFKAGAALELTEEKTKK